MAKPAQDFIDIAQKSVEDAGRVWDDLAADQQELVVAAVVKTYYEANPEEAKEILEREDEEEV